MMLCGPSKAIISYPINHGAILNIAVMDYEHPVWEHEKWIVSAKHGELDRMFEGWGESARGLIDLVNTPSLAAWSVWDLPPVHTYTKARVCMLGDAAHAMTPFQGQGAGQAIEDALVLTTLLSKVTQPAVEIRSQTHS